jgi:hypothetical protein
LQTSMKRLQQLCFLEKNIFKEFVRRERNEKSSVISIQMVMNRRFRDDGTWRSSVQTKQKMTKKRTLGDTIQKLINRRLRIPNGSRRKVNLTQLTAVPEMPNHYERRS